VFRYSSGIYSIATGILALFFIAACGGGGDGGGNNSSSSQWIVAEDDVVDGGPGVDGIPPLTNPSYESATTISTVEPDELVVAMRHEGQILVYPHDILDWHEIVNDGSAVNPFTLSYCPLTGSAVAWKGSATDSDPTFGGSGLLYNSNLILYDRRTNSKWSQMLQMAINGPRIRERPDSIQVVETKFSTLQQMFPNAAVLTRNTGHNRNYDFYPYDDYKTSINLLFPVTNSDTRLHRKERVMGVLVNGSSKVYQLAGFGPMTDAINDQVQGVSIVVVGNTDLNLAAVYDRQQSDGAILTFSPLQNDLPNVMTDSEGNVWDIFGMAVSGPRAGSQLSSTTSFTSYWFAWAAFYPNAEIHFN
jgi:hypothetical protein